MLEWPRNPGIYEINTRPWLEALGRTLGRRVTLSEVPAEAWDALATPGIDAVWLMGVWERSPVGREIALANQDLRREFAAALPDLADSDVTGSAYCVKSYTVDPALGGPDGLAAARRELANRGLRLIVDFIANHVARDHVWAVQHPEYFIAGSEHDIAEQPAAFGRVGGHIYACGRDPFFPPWEDVLQLNPVSEAYRGAAADVLKSIADQADGVRCDMAMLALSDVVAQTWAGRAGATPGKEFWAEVIDATRASEPGFLFVAEAYWGLEWQLQQLGFDYCYDKSLYDRLAHEGAASVRQHLGAPVEYQEKLIRFIENHDEARAASAFEPGRERAAAAVVATLPGARLWHDGQFEGRRTRLPVFLTRFPQEEDDQELRDFYRCLLEATGHPAIRDGGWRLSRTEGWPDNHGHEDFLAWEWRHGEARVLVTINFSGSMRDGIVRLDPTGLVDRTWQFADALSDERFSRRGDDLIFEGLYLALQPWSVHVYSLTAA